MPRIKMIMTACLFVKSQRKGVFGNDGKAAAITCGMVSPTMIQNATMPPKALDERISVNVQKKGRAGNLGCVQCPLSDLGPGDQFKGSRNGQGTH